jgi:hypothetical protein
MINEAGQVEMRAQEQAPRFMRGLARLVLLVAAATMPATPIGAGMVRAQSAAGDRGQRMRDERQPDADLIERTHREEGEAILALADAAMAGKAAPADFTLGWQNDFVKAQRGTFVPFTLTIDASRLSKPSGLVYVRAIRRDAERTGRDRREPAAYPVDAIFPVELIRGAAGPQRISRGFTVEPGDYDVFVVMRERVEPGAPRQRPKAAVLRQPLEVPAFGATELATSSLMVADRLTVLTEAVPTDRLAERPYAIGLNEITPAADRRFRRDEELIVVFLVYNPMVTSERQFDLKVEYHFFRQLGPGAPKPEGDGARPVGRPGEAYFNHTEPQRFNAALMGSAFDPRSGEPVMAGQVVPLSGFESGEYRLDIQVTDLLSGKSVSRDIIFTVES